MSEKRVSLTVERYPDGGFTIFLEQLAENEETGPTHAYVRVFYRHELHPGLVSTSNMVVTRSEFDVVPLLGRGVLMQLRDFSFDPDLIQFFRVELFRRVATEEHKP